MVSGWNHMSLHIESSDIFISEEIKDVPYFFKNPNGKPLILTVKSEAISCTVILSTIGSHLGGRVAYGALVPFDNANYAKIILVYNGEKLFLNIEANALG